jgi:polysaccharide biosynthesis protein PslG
MRSRPLHGRTARLCAALLLTAVCALGLPGLALGAGKALSTDLAWGIPQSAFAPTRAAITDLGARWVRIEFRWNEAEPSSKGSYDQNVIARYDQAVETARAAGAQVLVFVNGAPRWASGSRIPMTRPQNAGDYADFLRYVAARYAGRVSAWEVWNEENTQRFWSSGPNAAQYTQLLKAAYPAVKAADPGALVVFGGVSQNDYAFIEGAYQAGAKGSFDVMAVHPYPGPNPPEAVWYTGARVAPNAFTGFREVRTTMLAQADDKPLWLTEFGWSTTTTEAWGVTPTQQADYLTRAYHLLENYPYITQAYWYNLRNNFWDNDADTWETQLGLTRTDFAHKPSYDAFKNYQPGAAATPAQPGNEPSAGRLGGSTSEIAPRTRRATRTFITLRRRRLVSGRVAGASGGRVKITLSRLGDRGRWKRLRPRRVSLGRRQTFRLELVLPRPQMRVQAHYEGSATSGPSRSRVLTLPST